MTHEQDIIRLLGNRMKAHGVNATGRDLQMNPSFLVRVRDGLTPLSDNLAKALGYEKIVKYKRIK